MGYKIKTLKEVSEEIGENIGEFKKFNPQNGFYKVNFRGLHKNIEIIESKIRAILEFREKRNTDLIGEDKSTITNNKKGFFKSKQGYNSKFKNNKNFANHYGEYIAYIILKQLGKKACKVDIGEMDIRNPYSQKPITVEGILSHSQINSQEDFVPINVIVQNYKYEHPKKYREATQRGRTDTEDNYTNIEIVLDALEEYFKRNNQAEKIPEMRKNFFDMCIFDIKFANRDRHDENFGLKINQNTDELEFYDLFDNEQILGLQEDSRNISVYLSSENEYKKFKKRSLTSCVGIPGTPQKIEPQKLLRYLLENYYEETMSSIRDMENYKSSNLREVLDVCSGLSEEHKQFAIKIFEEREKEMLDTIQAFEKEKSEELSI